MSIRCCAMVLLLGLLVFAPAAMAGAPLNVSEFGDLQTAIDVAQDGDTIIVDVDTPGAVLDKRLTLRGIPGKATGLITGASFGNVSTGLVLDDGASGSELINLRIQAWVAIGSYTGLYGLYIDGVPDDVAVRGCRLEANAFGFYLINFDEPGKGGWVIEHNTIEIRDATQYFGGSFGVAMSGVWNDMRVAHNRIAGTKPEGQILDAGGVAVLAGAEDIEIVQNEIAVNIDPPVAGSWADAVVLGSGATTAVSNVTVALNDFRGSSTTWGPHGVTVFGILGAGSDLTGLGAFDHIPAGAGTPSTFAIGGNLSSGSGKRGELSASDVPVDWLLHPR